MAKKDKKSKKEKYLGKLDNIIDEQLGETVHGRRADRTTQKLYNNLVKVQRQLTELAEIVTPEGSLPAGAFDLCRGAIARVKATVVLIAQREGIDLQRTEPNAGNEIPFEVEIDATTQAETPMGVDAPKEF